MIPISELTRSVGPALAVLCIAVVAFSLLAGRSLGRLRRVGLKGWHRDDAGAAYTLSYVMTFPIYAIFMAVIVESSLMLACKIGTVYAAYAAARSAIVWSSAQPGAPGSAEATGRAQQKMERAAALALIPFSSASPDHAIPGGNGDSSRSEFLAAYRAHYNDDATADYLTRKYDYAFGATEVESPNLANHGPDDDIIVTVRFQYPFILPGIGRLLGGKPFTGAKFYTAEIETQAKLQTEMPQSESRTLGIEYQSE